MNILESYEWPGNVRELQNTIERATVLYDDIELKPSHIDFLGEITEEFSEPEKVLGNNDIVINLPENGITLEELEEYLIKKILKKFDGNKSKVAQYLNVSRNTIRRKLKEI
jgi:DNA-binding NtrC family response regulator